MNLEGVENAADDHLVGRLTRLDPTRFAVRFVYDITRKMDGKRVVLDEVAVFTVANEKIVREEFFYPVD